MADTAGQEYMVTGDGSGQITSWDFGAQAVFGLRADEAIGRPLITTICSGDFVRACQAIIAEVLRGREWEGEMLTRRADGEIFHTNLRLTPQFDEDGEVVAVTAVGQDSSAITAEGAIRQEFARYLVHELNLTKSTALTYENALGRLEKYLGKEASDIAPDEVRRFLRDTPYHPSTKNATVVAIKAYDRWGRLEGLWEDRGLSALRGPKQIRNPKPSLTTTEAATLLDACSRPPEYRAIYLGLYAGTRISESARIAKGSWLTEEGKLRFAGKGRKTREVPVHQELDRVRSAILSRQPSRDTLKHTCRSLAHYTGIDFTSHSLRRTMGVHLSKLGIERSVIGAILGHAPGSVTEGFYVPVRYEEMEAALGRLSYRG